MKKALSLLAVFLVAVMMSATAFSADKYASGSIGIVWPEDISIDPAYDVGLPNDADVDFDSGITLLGAFGCDYGDYRVEGELGFQTSDMGSVLYEGDLVSSPLEGDLTVLSLLVNGYYDIDLGGVELFGTAGVGLARVTFEDITYTDVIGGAEYTEHATTFAYQLGAGLALPVADNVMIDARYRYFSTTEFTLDDVNWFGYENTTVSSHSGLLGLRVNL